MHKYKLQFQTFNNFSYLPNKFLVRFFVSYHLHKYRLVSVIHRINAAFGVSQKFVPYRMPYDTLGRLKWKSYEIDLKSVTFTKSAGGAFYYSFSVSSDFSNIIAVNLNSFSYVSNKGYTALMNQSNLTVGVMVYDATDPQTLTFSNGQLWILVLGFS